MKKVTFNEDINKTYFLWIWTFAYNQARRNTWESAALDRIRFGQRIEEAALILNPILDLSHRNNVYEKLNKTQN